MLLRPFQSDALERLRVPGHLLCVAPTGSGKSLIYEKFAAESARRTLLITPLVALARQQAERLLARGIPVTLYPGERPRPKPPSETGIWIMSPESLQSEVVSSRLAQWRPDFLVVDECHCLYDWGERFRRAFMEVPPLVRTLRIPRSLWLTATLPPVAIAQLERALGSRLARVGKFSVPPNLRLAAPRIPWIHRAEFLLRHLAKEPGPGIVFVSTREATHRVGRLLSASGRHAIAYHAGLSHEERRGIERQLGTGKDGVLVATSAFGMGMDYAHLLWTVLWQPPPSLLSLAQAVGRVGRNRENAAKADIYWDAEDFRLLQWMTQGSKARSQALTEVHSYLNRTGCWTRRLEACFNEEASESGPFCGHCAFCEIPSAQ